MAPYARRAEQMRTATLLGLIALLIVLALDTLVMPSGGRKPNPVIWIALSIPLVILIPGIARGRFTTFTWLGFVSMLYFAQAVVAMFSPLLRALDILQLVLSIALFIGALLFIRWRARANRATAPQ